MTPLVPITIEPSRFLHTSIRASAGSGKTFQLTNRYLQLVAAGTEPSSILASTFTRLAAGQIRDRILMRLADAADDAKKRRELANHLGVKSLSRDSHARQFLCLGRARVRHRTGHSAGRGGCG